MDNSTAPVPLRNSTTSKTAPPSRRKTATRPPRPPAIPGIPPKLDHLNKHSSGSTRAPPRRAPRVPLTGQPSTVWAPGTLFRNGVPQLCTGTPFWDTLTGRCTGTLLRNIVPLEPAQRAVPPFGFGTATRGSTGGYRSAKPWVWLAALILLEQPAPWNFWCTWMVLKLVTLPGAAPPTENTRGTRNPYQDNHFTKARGPHKRHHDKGNQGPCSKLHHLMKATDLNNARTLFRNTVLWRARPPLQRQPLSEDRSRRVYRNTVPGPCSGTPSRNAVPVRPYGTLFLRMIRPLRCRSFVGLESQPATG